MDTPGSDHDIGIKFNEGSTQIRGFATECAHFNFISCVRWTCNRPMANENTSLLTLCKHVSLKCSFRTVLGKPPEADRFITLRAQTSDTKPGATDISRFHS